MAKDDVVILSKEEVDAGKAPAHRSCTVVTRNGKTEYHYFGKTGKAGRATAEEDAELKAELAAKAAEKERKEHDRLAAKGEKAQAKFNAPKPTGPKGSKTKSKDTEPDDDQGPEPDIESKPDTE